MNGERTPHWGMGARIVGAGHYLPPRVVTNNDIAGIVDTTDEWIQQRVGIRTRHFADTDSVPDMAEFAARNALGNAGVAASEVDLVVVATCSNIDRTPSTAGRVAHRLGVPAAAVFDVNAACSGFVHALEIAKQLLAGGSAATALVIGAEKMTAVTDWSDRATCVLVGDGAGALLLRATAHSELSPVAWGSAPELTNSVLIEGAQPQFHQDGQRVFRWAITAAAAHATAALTAANLTPTDLGAFIPHQANLRIIEPLAVQLGLPESAHLARDIQTSGNTSAASIPLALSKMLAAGLLKTGSPMLLFGFGGGFSYAGLVARAP
ncbi:beta-ketoacyl-ACP synthase III [Leucobacter komagatae]|nr:beta-ketoacyl-ACP synthase III [Leucobacter komagatae]